MTASDVVSVLIAIALIPYCSRLGRRTAIALVSAMKEPIDESESQLTEIEEVDVPRPVLPTVLTIIACTFAIWAIWRYVL